MSRTTRARSRAALAIAFEEHNPRRLVAWRWQLASKLSKHTKERPGRANPLLARAVRFRRRIDRCRSPGRLAQLRRADPDLFQAHDLYIKGGWSHVVVEGRLLARVPIADIAKRHGLSEEAVQLYTDLFFDVLPRLSARDWILSRAIGRARKDERVWQFAARQLKTYAYFRGPAMLDQLVEKVFDKNGAFLRDVPDLGTAEGRRTAKMRFMIQIDRPGKSLCYWRTQWENWVRLKEVERLAQRSMPEPEQLLIDVALAEEHLELKQVDHHNAEEQREGMVTAGSEPWASARTA